MQEKNISPCDCSKTGAVSKNVSNIAFFCMKFIGKSATFPIEFGF